jgi:peptide chain release factor 1
MKPAFEKILAEYDDLNEQMSSASPVELGQLGKKQSELQDAVAKILKLKQLEQAIADNKEMAQDADAEIKTMAEEELKHQELELAALTEEIEADLLPKDPLDANNILIEMRAGAGGDEATLFVAEMFRAYSKYAEGLGFSLHIVSSSKSEAGGYKEVVFELKGKSKAGVAGPYSYFKYESGVHRVQRVPETEKSGRVHTSTITVAVLPEVEENDFELDPKDLKIEATTSSGHGGQSVNTTYSAIRIVHIPTGITAQCQDERSQAQNKEKAMAVIRARVAAHYREIEEKKLKDARRSQIGTGDRSEKIRTYNFPQDRVTDHRINQNFNQVNLIMEGKLDDIVNALRAAELNLRKESLAA